MMTREMNSIPIERCASVGSSSSTPGFSLRRAVCELRDTEKTYVKVTHFVVLLEIIISKESYSVLVVSQHGVVLTLIQRCLDVNSVVTTLKRRCVLVVFKRGLIRESPTFVLSS